MKYKRLTEAEDYDCETDFCGQCEYQGEPNGCNNPNGKYGNYTHFCGMSFEQLDNLLKQYEVEV